MTFNSWLRKQRERDDPIGDLACDYIADCRSNRIAYRSIRSLRRVAHTVSDVLDEAIAEYRIARQAIDT